MFSTFEISAKSLKSVDIKSTLYGELTNTTNVPTKNLVFVGLTPRSRFGCLTCRKKKKRCNEVKPICGLCSKSGVECTWKQPGTERRNRKRGDVSKPSIKTKTPERKLTPVMKSPSSSSSKSDSISPKLFSDNEDFFLDFPGKNAARVLAEEDEIIEEIDTKSYSAPSPGFTQFLTDVGLSPGSMRAVEQMLTKPPSPIFGPQLDSRLLPLDESQVCENFQDRNGPLSEKDLCRLTTYSVMTNPDYYSDKVSVNEYGNLFFEFYKYSVVDTISIVPDEYNYFFSLFLPLAQSHDSVLSCLTTWGGLALYGSNHDLVKENMNRSLALVKTQELLASDHSDYIILLACYIILMSSHIYIGDVGPEWVNHLASCNDLIRNKIGFKNFKDYNERKLVSNFIYHDIVTCHHHASGTFLKIEEIEEFNKDEDVEPLQGILRPLYVVIGEIVNYSVELKERRMSVTWMDENFSLFEDFEQKFLQLDNKIKTMKPFEEDMKIHSGESLNAQLKLFELFRVVSQLYLRQVLKKYPPNVLEMQYLVIKCIHIVRDLITSEVRSTLCFPLFIIGMNCSDENTRRLLDELFDVLEGVYHVKNIVKCRVVISEIWDRNPDGDKWMDWTKVTKQFNWFLNLA